MLNELWGYIGFRGQSLGRASGLGFQKGLLCRVERSLSTTKIKREI